MSPSQSGPFTPRKEPRYPFYRRLVGPHSRCGRFALLDTHRPGRLAVSNKCVKPNNFFFSEYMGRRWTTVFFPEDRGRIHLQNTQTVSKTHPASDSVGAGFFSRWLNIGVVKLTAHLDLVRRLRKSGAMPYILESRPHPFYSFRGLKNQMQIRFAVVSWILEK